MNRNEALLKYLATAKLVQNDKQEDHSRLSGVTGTYRYVVCEEKNMKKVTITIDNGKPFTGEIDKDNWLILPKGSTPDNPWFDECVAEYGSFGNTPDFCEYGKFIDTCRYWNMNAHRDEWYRIRPYLGRSWDEIISRPKATIEVDPNKGPITFAYNEEPIIQEPLDYLIEILTKISNEIKENRKQIKELTEEKQYLADVVKHMQKCVEQMNEKPS